MKFSNLLQIFIYFLIFAYNLIAAMASYYMLRFLIRLICGDQLTPEELHMFYTAFAVILIGISFQNTGNVLFSFLSLIGLN